MKCQTTQNFLRSAAVLWLAAFLSWSGAQIAQARPVSYPGGWTFIEETDGFQNTGLIHFSPTASYSLGLRVERRRVEEFIYIGSQINYLARRWNMENAQANIYLSAGGGAAIGDFGGVDTRSEAAGFLKFAGDWETRRWFVSYSARQFLVTDANDFFTQRARFGVAPYVADYNALHTWLMVDIAHRPEAPDEVVVTPLVRFFKGPALLELGFGTDERVLANLIYRF
ncbi:MAG: hypothetical protein AAGF15_05420 [Pseudomonadota bacterium]